MRVRRKHRSQLLTRRTLPRVSLSAPQQVPSPRADRADHSVRRQQGKQAGRADRLIASPRQLQCGTYIYYIIAMLAPYAPLPVGSVIGDRDVHGYDDCVRLVPGAWCWWWWYGILRWYFGRRWVRCVQMRVQRGPACLLRGDLQRAGWGSSLAGTIRAGLDRRCGTLLFSALSALLRRRCGPCVIIINAACFHPRR